MTEERINPYGRPCIVLPAKYARDEKVVADYERFGWKVIEAVEMPDPTPKAVRDGWRR